MNKHPVNEQNTTRSPPGRRASENSLTVLLTAESLGLTVLLNLPGRIPVEMPPVMTTGFQVATLSLERTPRTAARLRSYSPKREM